MSVTWNEARIECNAKVVDHSTAHLVSVDRPEVNDLVSNWVFDEFGFTNIDGKIWIGAKQKDDGDFTWIKYNSKSHDDWELTIDYPVDGNYTNWADGSPDGANNQCVATNYLNSGNGFWGDEDCDTNEIKCFACEYHRYMPCTDDPQAPCDPNAVCTNVWDGGDNVAECSCNDGFSGDGITCADVDECIDGTHNCHINGECTNTPGSFTCACNDGFTGDGIIACDDVDECTDDIHNCDANATCTNLPGSFSCACNTGFTGDGIICAAPDECADETHNCDANATCTDTPEAFTCTCNAGFNGDGVTCVDNDECTDGSNNCNSNATCTNILSSFTCACNTGFTGDGITCIDDDECAAGSDNCDVNATCTNIPGSFTCACNAGFTGDGTTCIDDDECANDTDNCDDNATCSNIPGSFSCACNADFSGDGIICEPDDKCSSGNHNCNVNATCTETPDAFTCTCNSGFTGNGITCTDNDECTDGTHNCDPSENCTNTLGEFTCACPGAEPFTGSWTNANGDSITIAADGTVTLVVNGVVSTMTATITKDGDCSTPDDVEIIPPDGPPIKAVKSDDQIVFEEPPTDDDPTNPFTSNWTPLRDTLETTTPPVSGGNPGAASMSGDPHIKVQIPGEEAVCFDVALIDQDVVLLLSDSGIRVTGEIHGDGWKKNRLAVIGISTPDKNKISFYHDRVIINGEEFELIENQLLAYSDVTVEVLSHLKSRHRGALIRFPTGPIFHVATKDFKGTVNLS